MIVAIRMHPDFFDALKKSIPTEKGGLPIDPRGIPIQLDDAIDPHDPLVIERGPNGVLYPTPFSLYEVGP